MPWLLDATAFVTRDQCGDWGPLLPVLAQAADAAIALAYFAIPWGLLEVWKFRRSQGSAGAWVSLLFALFIFLCGLTHVCQVLAFWWPAYRLFTAVSVATALVSVFTAVVLPVWVRRLVRTPTAQAVLREADLGKDGTAALLKENAALKAERAVQDANLAYHQSLSRRVSVLMRSMRDRADAETARDIQEVRDLLRIAGGDGDSDPPPAQ